MGQVPRGPSISLKLPEMNLGNFKVSLCETLVRRICGGMTMPQNNPVIFPSLSTSIFSAAGTLGRPGIVMMSPVRATMKPGAGADLQVPHGDGEALGRTQQSGIVGQGILGLCHAHRQIAEAQIKELLGLLLGGGVRTACAPP